MVIGQSDGVAEIGLGRGGGGQLHAQLVIADANDIAGLQDGPGLPLAIDKGAIGGTVVQQHRLSAFLLDEGVAAGDAPFGEYDVVLRIAPQGDG